MFLDHSTSEKAYRLETFRSAGAVSATASQQLRCYFVTKSKFVVEGRFSISYTKSFYLSDIFSIFVLFSAKIAVFSMRGDRTFRTVLSPRYI